MARKSVGREAGAEGAPLAELAEVLGHRFRRPGLLTLALTHRSFVHEAGTSHSLEGVVAMGDPSQDNEQLEFLGDAVLGLLAADALCRRFPASREGELTRLRASVVSRKHLGEVGTRLGLGRWVRLGKGAERDDGRKNAAIFSDVVEALIAALYLDGGLPAAQKFVEGEILVRAMPALEQSLAGGKRTSGAVGDFKTALQETVHAQGLGQPRYRLVGEAGPAHRKVFRVGVELVWADGKAEVLGEGEGSAKKIAEQEAARIALEHLAMAAGESR